MVPRNPEKLTCLSIIICDDILRDERTKKLVLIGTFNTISAPAFPCRHARMCILFTVTNAKGNYDLKLHIEHEESGRKVVELGGPFHSDDPLAIADVNVEIRDVVFKEPGKYWVSLTADGEIAQQRPFVVQAPKEQTGHA